MENTNTAPAKVDDPRQLVANQIVGDSGIAYFNPLIGTSAANTCAKTEPVIELLYHLFDRNLVSEDMNPGLAKIVQTVWAAMQYERDTAEQSEGEAA